MKTGTSLKFALVCEDEVSIPVMLGAGPLTLEELGALIVFMGMTKAILMSPNDPERQAFDARFNDPRFEKMIADFKARGIVSASIEEGKIQLTVDLDKALFQDEPRAAISAAIAGEKGAGL